MTDKQTTEEEKISFRDTLNLPQTEFPMAAGLVKKEPQLLEKWKQEDLYKKLLKKNEKNTKFILHDGPPYPNGNIHLGHSLNKILKDIVVRYNLLKGHYSPYIPGWDCHGLPIETQLQKELSKEKVKIKSTADFRNRCKDYALGFVDKQREQFKRLGVMGDWDHPYLTLQPEYEAGVISVFAQCVEKGYVYRGQKPIHWCCSCKTALAEAEIEYEDHKSPSIYMKFVVEGTQLTHKEFNQIEKKDIHPMFSGGDREASFIVWTTTPWTMPANVAVAVNPEFIYVVVRDKNAPHLYIVAESLAERVMSKLGIEYEVKGKLKGSDLDGIVLKHPFIDRESPVVLADYVTAEDGTGCVHIAPGHGQEDHVVGKKYNLPTIMPVDASGKFTEEAGEFAGMNVFDANAHIIEKMKKMGTLFKVEIITHSYPHCWRCHKPVIFRATPQWFIAMDTNPENNGSIREKALREIEKTKWIPSWGHNRINGMMKGRPDWCISRQRSWGIPIPIFYCKKCHEPQMKKEFLDIAIDAVKKNGSNVWFEKSAQELLGHGFLCACGGKEFEKETDIMDVWLESGASYKSVLQQGTQLSFPADLYLEGSDQHRGWFHSALLLSVAAENQAPYKAVLTHGFTVDDKGRKMSKSLGNTVDPLNVIEQSGADVLRLWVASTDFKNDLALSPAILKQVSDGFVKIRNTWRFLLSNLYDYGGPIETDGHPSLSDVDAWMMSKLHRMIKDCNGYYDNYEFHRVYHTIYDFCVNDLSALYCDIHKDNLYCNKADDPKRRSVQFVFKNTLEAMVKIMTPVLAFTAEDIWSFMGNKDSVHEQSFPVADEKWINPALEEKFAKILAIREEVNKQLEPLRKDKQIASSLQAEAVITLKDPIDFTDWAPFLIVSRVEIVIDPSGGVNPSVKAFKSPKQKCLRCWRFDEITDHLCPRCQSVVHP